MKEKILKLNRANTIGKEEISAANRVLKSGILSDFIGAPGEKFYGGKEVVSFEHEWASYFGVKNAISVNSWTSGLITIIGSLQLEPGDEVITSPWTMCATATSILHWNLIPVFADIDPVSFNITVESIKSVISERTKAILAVDIFGRPCDYEGIMSLCEEHNLTFVTDSAQAPGLKDKTGFWGTKSHIGGFSLNYHKHIHTGEGGMIITDNDILAKRCALIRNHAEACMMEEENDSELKNMVGFNFRMGEIEAAIGREQLKKLKLKLSERQNIARRLVLELGELPYLRLTPLETIDCNAFYIFPIVLESSAIKLGRDKICSDLESFGLPVTEGYQNIHRLPIFERKIAFGEKQFPWTLNSRNSEIKYGLGTCPVAEKLHDESFIGLEICAFDFSESEVAMVAKIFNKLWKEYGFI